MMIIIAKHDITRVGQGEMADTFSASMVSATPYLRKKEDIRTQKIGFRTQFSD
jgi:hypothetical protein